MRLLALPLLVLIAGCGGKSDPISDLHTKSIRLPGSQEIRAEVVMNATDVMRGMMFRDSLEPDRGMLFIHGSPGFYQYWMYQVRIPLDIIWLDQTRTIIEISADTPPCNTKASECPKYGGNQRALYVLELAGGMAERYNLRVGQTLQF